MSPSPRSAILALCCLPLAAAAVDAPQTESAPVVSQHEIIESLHPAATRAFKPRGLARRDQVTESVSLNVPFEHNSSTLQPTASEQLHQLELALASPALRGDRFLVAGHTDAQGSARYNKQLSLRRAETVKRFLVEHGIDAGRIDTVGFGSERLLAPDRPYDSRNRRVEIRDMGAAGPAGQP